MLAFIPLNKTMHDFQRMLKPYALTGKNNIDPSEIIDQLQKEPIYDIDYVIQRVTSALVAKNEKTNCITGNSTEHVIVTKEKLDEVLGIIKHASIKPDEDGEYDYENE